MLTYLGDEADHYGRQRMFGSLGWGLAMFFVGIALDHSTAFPGHPCGPHEKERNYTICFAVFSVLMGCALITASQFKVSEKVLSFEKVCLCAGFFFLFCTLCDLMQVKRVWVFLYRDMCLYLCLYIPLLSPVSARTTYDTYLLFSVLLLGSIQWHELGRGERTSGQRTKTLEWAQDPNARTEIAEAEDWWSYWNNQGKAEFWIYLQNECPLKTFDSICLIQNSAWFSFVSVNQYFHEVSK